MIRAFALRAGELTGVGNDVFFLTIDEILALLAGDDVACQFIPERRETYARYRALPPYPTIIVWRFDPFEWAADTNRRSDIYDANAPGNEITEGDVDSNPIIRVQSHHRITAAPAHSLRVAIKR